MNGKTIFQPDPMEIEMLKTTSSKSVTTKDYDAETLRELESKTSATKGTETQKNGEDDASVGNLSDIVAPSTDAVYGSVWDYYGENLLFEGTPDSDSYVGRYGDDTMMGSANPDTFNGSYGLDTVDYSDSPSAVMINLEPFFPNGYSFQQGGDAQGDRLAGVERIIGTSFDDTFVGDQYDNIFEGRGGNDTFRLDPGRDTYLGGEGDGDTLIVEDSNVTIDLMLGVGKGGNAEGDHYDSIEKISAWGRDITVIGSNNGETVRVGGLDATLKLNGGNDTIVFSALDESGADIDGGTEIDTIDFSLSIPSLNIDLSRGTFELSGGALGVSEPGPGKIANVENVIGTSGGDIFVDDKSDNTFTGGASDDVFAFNHSDAHESDTITDFEVGVDSIDLSMIDSIDKFELFTIPNPYDLTGQLPLDMPVDQAIELLYAMRETDVGANLLKGIAFMEQDGSDVIVHTDFGNFNEIVLEDTQVADLQPMDFIL